MSLTKKPMNPMIAKPIAVARAIFWNSANKSKKVKITLSWLLGMVRGSDNLFV